MALGSLDVRFGPGDLNAGSLARLQQTQAAVGHSYTLIYLWDLRLSDCSLLAGLHQC